MNEFERKLKDMAHAESGTLPQWAHNCVEDALASLPVRRKKHSGLLRIIGTAVAAMLVIFAALPNLSAQAAEQLQSLPLLGPFFQVVTFRTYVREDPYHPAQVEIPKVELSRDEDEALRPAVEQVNEDIQSMTDRLIAQFEQDAEDIGSGGHTNLSVRSEVVTNTGEWFTLRLEVHQGGGSGITYYRYYHINKKSGETVRLSELFASQEYVEAISGEIISQMRADSTQNYWVDGDNDALNFRAIDPDQNFYFAENGDIVIAFDKYEVAPGSAGCPTFQIPRSVYAEYLK
ncbi:MAG: RsiV family protein [Clostridiales bacterium]|nr:RsiV family protein [Clostridiales bacterium]